MKLGTRARYAVMAMADLAKEGGPAPMPLADIAGRQAISLDYLEQLFTRLRRRGLVTSARGPGGGYRLSRPAGDIRIGEIVAAVEGPVRTTRCEAEGAAGCMAGQARCMTHDLWEELGRQIHLFLMSVTLADVVGGQVLGRAGLAQPARAAE